MNGVGTGSKEPEQPAPTPAPTPAPAPPQAAPGRARGGGRSRTAQAQRQAAVRAAALLAEANAEEGESAAAPQAAPAAAPATEHVPSAMELAADPEDLKIIRELFGSRAQTILNALLAFDSYFIWYYPFKKSVPFMCAQDQRLEFAFANTCRAIDMQEMYERVTIRAHSSYLPHGAVYKMSSDILEVGNTWVVNVSPLELQNAETKRVAETGGSRRLQISTEGMRRDSIRAAGVEGPARLTKTKGYTTTMSISTLKNMLVAQKLRRGDGVISIAPSRRHERLFGASGSGRTKHASSGVKIEKLGADYDPKHDTCVKAFVRLLAFRASSDTSDAPGEPTA